MWRMEAHKSDPEIIGECEDHIDLFFRHLSFRCSDTLDVQIMSSHECVEICLIERIEEREIYREVDTTTSACLREGKYLIETVS